MARYNQRGKYWVQPQQCATAQKMGTLSFDGDRQTAFFFLHARALAARHRKPHVAWTFMNYRNAEKPRKTFTTLRGGKGAAKIHYFVIVYRPPNARRIANILIMRCDFAKKYVSFATLVGKAMRNSTRFVKIVKDAMDTVYPKYNFRPWSYSMAAIPVQLRGRDTALMRTVIIALCFLLLVQYKKTLFATANEVIRQHIGNYSMATLIARLHIHPKSMQAGAQR